MDTKLSHLEAAAPSKNRRLTQHSASQNATALKPCVAINRLMEVVYTPDSSLRRLGILLSSMFRDLISSRESSWQLFLRNLEAPDGKSLLKYMWILLPPVVATLFFEFLGFRNILNIRLPNISYPAYILIGTLLWYSLAFSITNPLGRIWAASSMRSTYVAKNREKNHICYISNLMKIRIYYSEWNMAKSLEDIFVEIYESWQQRLDPQAVRVSV